MVIGNEGLVDICIVNVIFKVVRIGEMVVL